MGRFYSPTRLLTKMSQYFLGFGRSHMSQNLKACITAGDLMRYQDRLDLPFYKVPSPTSISTFDAPLGQSGQALQNSTAWNGTAVF